MYVAVKKMKAVRTTCTTAKETSSAEKYLFSSKLGAPKTEQGENVCRKCVHSDMQKYKS